MSLSAAIACLADELAQVLQISSLTIKQRLCGGLNP